MKAPNVDLVIVIDASSSMRPCIDALRSHLRELVKPMQGHVARVRFGFVSLSASKVEGSNVYVARTAAGGGDSIGALYGGSQQHEFFTADPDAFIRHLDRIDASGNEHNLLALDIALDHPFGPCADTKRVVALFSDEPLEDGVDGADGVAKLPQVIEKIHRRRIKLFCALPFSDAAQQLSEANGSEIEAVNGGQGLSEVDFRELLGQMGKSISVSALQGALVEGRPKAIFGQDEWVDTHGWNDHD